MQNACKVHFGRDESAPQSMEGNLLPLPRHFGQDPSLFTVDARRSASFSSRLREGEKHLPRHGQFPAAPRGLRDAANGFLQPPLFPPLPLGRGRATHRKGASNREPGRASHPRAEHGTNQTPTSLPPSPASPQHRLCLQGEADGFIGPTKLYREAAGGCRLREAHPEPWSIP